MNHQTFAIMHLSAHFLSRLFNHFTPNPIFFPALNPPPEARPSWELFPWGSQLSLAIWFHRFNYYTLIQATD